MNQNDNTYTIDVEITPDEVCDSMVSVLLKNPSRKPLSAEAVDLIEEFKKKFPGFLINDNNHEIDHSGG